jgi:uncharacterized alkaline shock family protein YloU
VTDTTNTPRDDPGLRGALHIAPRALHTVATVAARTVPGVTSTGGGLANLAGRTLPRAEVIISGEHARAHVTIAIAWPASANRVATAVRTAVTHDLHTLCGYSIDRVDVDVRCAESDTDTPRSRRVQ